MQGTPSAATPVPQPALAPPASAAAAVRSIDSVASPTADAQSALARCNALVQHLEQDVLRLLDHAEHAYHSPHSPPSCVAPPLPPLRRSASLTSPPPRSLPEYSLDSLSALISLLSRSALGAFVPPPPPSPPAATAAGATAGPSDPVSKPDPILVGTAISQVEMDQAQARSHALFKELQTIHERAEVVRAGLAR